MIIAMVEKQNKVGGSLLISGIVIICLTILFRKSLFLLSFGPQGWIQDFMAAVGFLLVFASLILTSWAVEYRKQFENSLIILLIIGGLYSIEMSFVLSLHPNWLDRSIFVIGLIFLIIGLSLHFFKFAWNIHLLKNPYIMKILLITWVVILLFCFLLYWGAPVEFWAILNRFGFNVSLLRRIQLLLNQFFTNSPYS
jgi:hypothetical protein